MLHQPLAKVKETWPKKGENNAKEIQLNMFKKTIWVNYRHFNNKKNI